ncbi:hypothetical protein EZH22_30615 (plasmid) [Xanthobacter dioxanivorans]|uniref:Uncharacterized protein n=1 Tax=Xanthobacter dioxanivorans TaxID=2528964 RepID=A0A974PVN0_9HYPH|nr:hypothetical protein [Xanthobacter dioxanivorans]QRG10083.1 hypothetical protein EZH22_30615 [Xanthobacter dioxanivorans]
MEPDWKRPLARVLRLKGGEELRTLRDAGEFAQRRWGQVRQSAAIQHTVELLMMRAAETGDAGDIAEATAQLEHTLVSRREI